MNSTLSQIFQIMMSLCTMRCQLIRSDTVISAVVCFQKIRELDSNLELSKASHKAISYAKEIFTKNVSFLKKGFTPETDKIQWNRYFL